ncbi:MAG: hypothetical protein EOO07_32310, partial [Chitinophagaceae bacterium]
MQVKDSKGEVYYAKKYTVKVHGGIVYGQLLIPGINLLISKAGYSTVSAIIKQGTRTICAGDDKIFAVKLNPEEASKNLIVADTSGVIPAFLNTVGVTSFKKYASGRPDGKVMVVGAFNPQQTGNPLVTDVLEWVNNGNTLVIAANFEKWVPYLVKKEVIDFKGLQELGQSWFGGNFFVKDDPLFSGLPQSCVFNWEYQCLATYNKKRWGMRIHNGSTVVACVSDHKQEVFSALQIIPHGRGKIILTTLDILSCLKQNEAEIDNDPDSVAKLISDRLLADQPCMIARFGANELAAICNFTGVNNNSRSISGYITGKAPPWWWEPNIIKQLHICAGFFPASINNIDRFSRLMLDDIQEIDILGSWLKDESYLRSELKSVQKVHLELLNPFFSKEPWTSSLIGKKVLV